VPVAYDGHTATSEFARATLDLKPPGISFTREGGGEQHVRRPAAGRQSARHRQKIDLEWESDVDRESLGLTTSIRHFLESFTRLTATYVDSDDGKRGGLRPGATVLSALDVRRAGGVFWRWRRIESRYHSAR